MLDFQGCLVETEKIENHELSSDGRKNYQVMGQNISTATCFDYQVVVHNWKNKESGLCKACNVHGAEKNHLFEH